MHNFASEIRDEDQEKGEPNCFDIQVGNDSKWPKVRYSAHSLKMLGAELDLVPDEAWEALTTDDFF